MTLILLHGLVFGIEFRQVGGGSEIKSEDARCSVGMSKGGIIIKKHQKEPC